MQRAIYIKINILLILVLCFSCEKNEPIEVKESYDQKPIDFSFADSIAGTYTGEALVGYNPGPENYDTVQLTINVIDCRTEYECKFYIDYLHDTVILYTNGYFQSATNDTEYGGYNVAYRTNQYFSGNKFIKTNTVSGKLGRFTTFKYEGIRQ